MNQQNYLNISTDECVESGKYVLTCFVVNRDNGNFSYNENMNTLNMSVYLFNTYICFANSHLPQAYRKILKHQHFL